MDELRNYIGGQFLTHSGGQWMDNSEPATGSHICRIPLSDASDVDAAVGAARAAQPAWGSLSHSERADWLDRIADGLETRYEEIAALESRDTGKPISLARTVDAHRSVLNFRFFAGILREREEDVFEMASATNYVVNKPVGVGALITPWNLPL